MKVSVLTVTYNHEQFLAHALESGLAQQTDFPWELVLSEDCSTDQTRAVAQRYAKARPDRVRLLLSEKNLGLTRNTARAMQACGGEYIAILEGDDFWTHDGKLQRQADYLDAHPDCAWCFTRARVVNADGEPLEVGPAVRVVQSKYSLGDYLARRFQPRFCTVMFRARLFPVFPEWFFAMPTADFPLHVLNTEHGKSIGFIDEEMAAYRIHPGGVWSQGIHPGSWPTNTRAEWAQMARRLAELVMLYENADCHLGGAHRRVLREQIAAFAEQWTQLNVALEAWPAARHSAWLALRARLASGGVPGVWLVRTLVRSWIAGW